MLSLGLKVWNNFANCQQSSPFGFWPKETSLMITEQDDSFLYIKTLPWVSLRSADAWAGIRTYKVKHHSVD